MYDKREITQAEIVLMRKIFFLYLIFFKVFFLKVLNLKAFDIEANHKSIEEMHFTDYKKNQLKTNKKQLTVHFLSMIKRY